jgi:hypothetical protein
MTENNVALPPLLGWQLAGYLDRCPSAFGPVALWRDS